MQPATDRRRTPRHATRLPLQLRIPGAEVGEDANAVALDLSLAGVRCAMSATLPLMTQVGLVLVLPGPHGAEHHLHCQGVVVRSGRAEGESAGAGAHETAIFFTSMSDGDRLVLDDFLRLAAGEGADDLD